MTPQQVIQSFMGKLVDHGYSYSDSIGTAMLNSAVKSSSEFNTVQEVIDAMKADQIKAEKEAVEEVLGSGYAGKTLSEIPSTVLTSGAKNYDGAKISNSYLSQTNDRRATVADIINERKAYIFLEKYCGIQLAKKYWFTGSKDSSGKSIFTYWSGSDGLTGNVDTGAITGSDANITLTAGEVINGTTLTAANLKTLKATYDTAASLSSDGQTIVIGTGVEKTDRSVVPETGNKYTATTSQAQNIKTGSNDWIVVATSGNDTITTGGADSVNAGAGNDKITVGADYATILTGAGNDSVEISAEVRNVTIGDLNSNDVLKISGTFNVGSAKIEDTMLVITDKTGKRKIRLGDLENAKKAKINSTTIGAWLTNAGIDLNNLSVTSSSNKIFLKSKGNDVVSGGEDQIAIEEISAVQAEDFIGNGEGQTTIDADYTPTPIQTQTRAVSESQDLPQQSASSTGEVNVNLDNVTLTDGNLNLDGSKVGEISNEFPGVTSYTKNGLTINLVGTTSNTNGYPDNFTSKTFDQLTDDEKTIVAGLFKWWGKESLKLNEESYGIGFESSTAQVKEIGLYFYDGNGSSNALAAVWNWSTAGTGQNTTQLMLNVNMDYYTGIKEDNLDGETSAIGAGFLDRTLAHEFTHAVMATNIHYFNKLPKFIKEGMAELTHGIDDERPSTIFRIAYDADWLDASLDLDNKGTGSQNIGDGYSGGYMFMRYLAKQSALQSIVDELDTVNPLLISLTAGVDTYSNTLAEATILALGGNDKVTNKGASVSVDGGAGNDYLYSVATKVTLTGGEGNDTLENLDNVASKNNMLLGGAGADSIKNYGNESFVDGGADNDYIYNMSNSSTLVGGTGNDTVYNYGASVSTDAGDGADYVYSNGVNSTLDGGAGNDTIDNRATLKSLIDGGAGNDFIKSTANAVTVFGGAGNDTINNNKGGSNASINGGDNDDYIKNISYNSSVTMVGGAGNDTIENAGLNALLIGGKGDDLINISGSNNLIQYTSGDGNDSIIGFNATSTLKIGNGTTDSYFKSKDSVSGNVYVSVGGGVITLSGAASLTSVNILGKEVSTVNPLLISLTAGADTYSNSLTGATIQALGGNDRITNTGASVSVDLALGNDYLYNKTNGSKSTLLGGEGNDTIINLAREVSIDGGNGNDSIHSTWGIYDGEQGSAYNVSVSGGEGNDTITGAYSGGGGTSRINGDAGDDYIHDDVWHGGETHDITIDGGTGNDTINAGNGSVLGGAGNDSINVHGGETKTTVNGGTGNDTIVNSGEVNKQKLLIEYASGDGNDLIFGFKTSDTLQIGNGTTDSYFKSKDSVSGNVYVSVGGGVITLSGAASLSGVNILGKEVSVSPFSKIITLTANNDTYSNTAGNVAILALAGNDRITNSGASVSVDLGLGNDYLYNSASDVTINAGEGNDTIATYYNNYHSIKGGTGNDLISLYSAWYSTIDAGDGDDTILTALPYNANKNSINGGAGNDKISLSTIFSEVDTTIIGGTGNDTVYGNPNATLGNLYQYASGDGNDLMYNFSKLDTLKIGNGTSDTYSSIKSGNDFIITVGEGDITLKGVASLSAVHVAGKYVDGSTPSGRWELGDGQVSYIVDGEILFTIYGISSNAKVSDFSDPVNNIVTISKNALGADEENDTFLEGEGYTLKLASDIPQVPIKTLGGWGSLVSGKATYTTNSYSAYYSLDDNTITYNPKEGGEKLTLSGIKSVSSTAVQVDEENKIVKLFGTALGTDNVTLDGDGYSLALDMGVTQDPAISEPKFTSLTNGTVTYKIFGGKAYYTLDGNEVLYTAATADNTFTISGLSSNLTLVNGAIAGISVDRENLKFTVNASALKDSDVTLSGTGATLELGTDVIKTPQNIAQAWSEVVNGTASYSTNGKTKYYTLTNGKIVYHAASAGDLQLTLSGLSSTAKTVDGKISGLTVSGKYVTISSAAVGQNVALQYNNGFDVNLASDVKNISFAGTSGVDTITNNGSNNSIFGGEGADRVYNYAASVSVDGGADNDYLYNYAADYVTINTAQGNDTIKLGSSVKSFTAEGFGAGDVIELYSSATKLETISGGIKAGNVTISGVTNIATVNNYWSTSTNSISYNQSTVAGAKLSGTKITYDAAGGTESLFTISGIKSTTGVALGGKEVTLSGAALNGVTGTVSISGGDYKLKLASDVDTLAENTSGWTTLTSGNVAYFEGGKGSYYSLSSDGKSVTYNASVAGANKVEFGGVKGTPTVSGTTVSLTADNFNGNVSVASNAGKYKFALSGAFGGKKFTGTNGVDTITNSGSNISIDGAAGNDTFINSGTDVTLTGGKGNDVFAYSKGTFKITDYTANADKISLDIAKVEEVALNNNDVTLSLGGSDSITIANGKNKKVTVTKPKTAQYIFGDHFILNGGKTSVSLKPAATKFDANNYSAVVTVNASLTSSSTEIIGNAKANKIYAGDNGSTLKGSKGNDTLWGGAGVDVFVYEKNTGNDIIQNFTSGQDKISLGAGANLSGFSVSKSGDAVLKIAGNNLTIKKTGNENIANDGKKITIIDAAGNETSKTYFTNRTVYGNGVTLNAEYSDTFTASSNIVTVDATSNSNSLVLNGNGKNNILTGGAGNDNLLGGAGNDKLFGSEGDDTLSGGKGNDTLTGGDGDDLFVYTEGKDVIADYASGDRISIGAAISNSSLKGTDAIFTIGKGTLTVKEGKGKEISFTDAKGKTRTIIGGAQLITDSTAAKTTLASSVAVADASSRTKAIRLVGNALANTILGGTKNDSIYGGKGNDSIVGNAGNDKLYGEAGNDILVGGSGNDSLWGGAGNDSLFGGAGKDTFIYKPGEGTDKIMDYESGDMLKILKSNGTAGGTFTKATFSNGNLTLAISGGGSVIFDGVASGDKFNINGKTYTISGKTLK